MSRSISLPTLLFLSAILLLVESSSSAFLVSLPHSSTTSSVRAELSQTAASTRLLSSSAKSGFGNKSSKKNYPDTTIAPASSSPSLPSPPSELFELQELRAQLATIIKQNIPFQSLSNEKRAELSKYVEAVIDKTESPINFSGQGGNTMGIANFVAGVENKSWRMVFTTDGGGDGGGGALPSGSTVILRIGEFLGMQGTLDYVLKYGERILGLNELVAKSACSVDVSVAQVAMMLLYYDLSICSCLETPFSIIGLFLPAFQIGPINPGLLTFQYEDIKSNIFGVSNLPVGFFGLLKGRVNCIDTIWFDGERWIERNYTENGDVVYSVYVRDVEDEGR